MSQTNSTIATAVQKQAQRAHLNPALVLHLATQSGLSLPLMLDLLTNFQHALQALANGSSDTNQAPVVQDCLQRFEREREALFKKLEHAVKLRLPEELKLSKHLSWTNDLDLVIASQRSAVYDLMTDLDTWAHQLMGLMPTANRGDLAPQALLNLAWSQVIDQASRNPSLGVSRQVLCDFKAKLTFNRITHFTQNEGVFLKSQWEAILGLSTEYNEREAVALLALQHTADRANDHWGNANWKNWPTPFPNFADAARFVESEAPTGLLTAFVQRKPPLKKHGLNEPVDADVLKAQWRLLSVIGQMLQDIDQLSEGGIDSQERQATIQRLVDLVQLELKLLHPQSGTPVTIAWGTYVTQGRLRLEELRQRIPAQ